MWMNTGTDITVNGDKCMNKMNSTRHGGGDE